MPLITVAVQETLCDFIWNNYIKWIILFIYLFKSRSSITDYFHGFSSPFDADVNSSARANKSFISSPCKKQVTCFVFLCLLNFFNFLMIQTYLLPDDLLVVYKIKNIKLIFAFLFTEKIKNVGFILYYLQYPLRSLFSCCRCPLANFFSLSVKHSNCIYQY